MLQNTQALRDGHKAVKAKLWKFMPIEKAILGMTVRHLPSPLEGQPRKIDSLAMDFKNKTRAFMSCRNAIV